MEGTLGSWVALPLTGWRHRGSWRRGVHRLLTKDGSRGGERESGDLAVAPTGRQRVSEVATSGEAPPAEGRRGSAAAEKRLLGVTHERGDPGQDESRAAPDDKSQPKLPRRKTVASEGGSGSANCATRPTETGAVRRCHAAPQAQREGFESIE
jgi:hypothetical protein